MLKISFFVFVYLIGRQFYQLANQYGRNKLGFAIIGVLFYYLSSMLPFLLFLMLESLGWRFPPSAMPISYIIGIPVGLLSIWLFYILIQKKFEQGNPQNSSDDLLDDSINH